MWWNEPFWESQIKETTSEIRMLILILMGFILFLIPCLSHQQEKTQPWWQVYLLHPVVFDQVVGHRSAITHLQDPGSLGLPRLEVGYNPRGEPTTKLAEHLSTFFFFGLC